LQVFNSGAGDFGYVADFQRVENQNILGIIVLYPPDVAGVGTADTAVAVTTGEDKRRADAQRPGEKIQIFPGVRQQRQVDDVRCHARKPFRQLPVYLGEQRRGVTNGVRDIEILQTHILSGMGEGVFAHERWHISDFDSVADELIGFGVGGVELLRSPDSSEHGFLNTGGRV